MSNLDVFFTVVYITETWLNNADVNTHELPGYQHEFDYRRNKRGGGVSIGLLIDIMLNKSLELILAFQINLLSLFIEVPKTYIR